MSTNKTDSISYKDAGVDTEAGQYFVRQISKAVGSTHNQHVFKDKAGFAGLMDISFLKDYAQPLLVSATDGVGTKLHLARLFNRHETVGIDLVAMCVNDLLATGAKSLQFLDYIACGKLIPSKMLSIVEGVSEGCRQANCVLAGGETAEHPDTMALDEYDLAGFVTGVVDASKRITGDLVVEGDILIALPSSGVHSNGMSLVRRLFLKNGLELPENQEICDFLLNEILLKPTIIYESILRPFLDDEAQPLHGIVHITGGGFDENIPRILANDLAARIDTKSYTIPTVFQKIEATGVDHTEMFNVFNMGAGMIVAVGKEEAPQILTQLQRLWGQQSFDSSLAPWIIGTVVPRNDGQAVELIG